MSNMEADEPITEELSAYLDGELDADARRRVEERLARDPLYHRELQRLERAWGLLDRLDHAAVSESFTKTTIEMVAVAAAADLEEEQKILPRRRRRQWAVFGGVTLAASLAGFALGKAVWPNPNDPLLQDLPVIENVDLYRQADSIEFLRLLDTEGIFAEEVDHAG